MIRMKERGKWLVALLLCLSCFALCATLMAAPTLAEEAPKKEYEAVAGYKNVYERLDAEGKAKSPKEFFYASGTAPAQVYNAALKEAQGKYTISVYGVESAGQLQPRDVPLKANGTLDTANPAPPTEPPADPPVLKAETGRTNIYELCNKDGVSLEPKKYVYACSTTVQNELYLVAHKLGSKFYLKLAENVVSVGDVYAVVALDGTLDCNDVISAGMDKMPGTADDAVLYPLPAPVHKYKAVENYKNLYERLGTDGKSKSPKEFLYSTKAPEDGKEPPTQSQQALVKGDTYYVSFLENSGVFLAVSADGTLNFGSAIWWGLDGKFGTTDDLATSVKEDSGYFYWQQGQGVWQMIQGIFNPAHTTTAAPVTTTTSTTAAVPAYKYMAVENYKNLFELLGEDGKSRSPKEYLYSETAPVNGSAPPSASRTAFAKGSYYYVPLTTDSGIFLPVNTDGTLSYTKVIWWGIDKKFGTADDFETAVKEEAGSFYWQQADGAWQLITGIVCTTQPTTTTTINNWLTTQGSELPKTGKEANPGLAVCMALLLMACAYCGFQAFRRRAIRARAR